MGYVLTGDGEVTARNTSLASTQKEIYRRSKSTPLATRRNIFYEPEGLYVRKGRILFTMYDRFWTRVYEVQAK